MKRALISSVALLSLAMATTAPAQPPTTDAPAATRKTGQKSVRSVVQAMTDATGITVLADSTIATALVLPPDGETTATNLEDRLDRLVKRLPAGTKWARVLLPALENGKRYSADAVTQFVRAQAGLFGKSGESKPGTVEILGRKLAEADAQEYIKGLNLVPVYILSNLSAPARAVGIGGAGGDPGSNPIMDALFKQLGVASAKDIPTGSYRVPYTLPDGSTVDANVHIENDGSSIKIAVEVGAPPP